MDSNDRGHQESTGEMLNSVRSGHLVPNDGRTVPARVDDSSAITPERAIPPTEITDLLDHYRHVDPEEAMIPVFQEMQTRYGYITQAAADQVCAELGLPEANVYGVLTFYSFFRYTPRAGHVIMSCEGTGCYVRGAARVRQAIEDRLNVGPGETSADGHWTFEPQSICLGACDLGPLVDVEGRYYSYVTSEKMNKIIDQWESDDAQTFPPVGDGLSGGVDHHKYANNYGFGPRSDELYAGYEVERFMQNTPGATNTTGATGTGAAPTPGSTDTGSSTK